MSIVKRIKNKLLTLLHTLYLIWNDGWVISMNIKNKNLSLWDKTNNLHKKYKLIFFENIINLNRIVA